ncbi:MAG: glycine cleavage system aminomethyltransferase GcvT [Bacillota bacterium]|nr:glycine cleavage system aminomethyltransferase GcvT [Bacillota bacterium]
MDETKRTPLYEAHLKLGGKMMAFAGYWLPVQYSGIIEEHHAVRNACGLFDVSHMGRFIIEGDGAAGTLEWLCTNDIASLPEGAACYTFLCNASGGVIDDILVYKLHGKYMLVVNAANREKAWRHLMDNAGGACIRDSSDETAQIALQGPGFLKVLDKLGVGINVPAKRYRYAGGLRIAGLDIELSTTGYTGEEGVEIFCRAGDAAALYDALYDAGADFGLRPCGLGCRDTLRMEAAMPLYGHELGEDISPLEAGLHTFVKLDKTADFIGKQALLEQEEKGVPRTRIGLKLLDRGIPRQGCGVLFKGNRTGTVTSGGFCPTLGGSYAMALIDSRYAEKDVFKIVIRDRALPAQRVDMPFYKRSKQPKQIKGRN